MCKAGNFPHMAGPCTTFRYGYDTGATVETSYSKRARAFGEEEVIRRSTYIEFDGSSEGVVMVHKIVSYRYLSRHEVLIISSIVPGASPGIIFRLCDAVGSSPLKATLLDWAG